MAKNKNGLEAGKLVSPKDHAAVINKIRLSKKAEALKAEKDAEALKKQEAKKD